LLRSPDSGHSYSPLVANKTVLSYVATYNAVERRFAEFRDEAPADHPHPRDVCSPQAHEADSAAIHFYFGGATEPA
jgi:hypothetical protein